MDKLNDYGFTGECFNDYLSLLTFDLFFVFQEGTLNISLGNLNYEITVPLIT